MSLIGVEIETFANGYFGRDSYGRKIVVAEGPTWVTVIDHSYAHPGGDDTEGVASSTNFSTEEEKNSLFKDWIQETKDGVYTGGL